ncbi:phage tail protein [Kitasatospora sp. McL0602]|uniref:phage tail protein n=1 Tax=Kitasatospora sp. McL0602 TaxID=3439530 RepID=UPI003F8B898C
MNVGELTATYDIDATGAEEGIARQELALRGLARDTNATAASIRRDMEGALRRLPTVQITADSGPLDERLLAVRHQLQDLARERVGVTIDAEEAQRRLDGLWAELEAIGGAHPEPAVRVQTGLAHAAVSDLVLRLGELAREDHAVVVHVAAEQAEAELAAIAEEARRVGDLDPHIEVHVDEAGEADRAARDFSRLTGTLTSTGSAAGGMAGRIGMVLGLLGAALPVAAGLSAALLAIAPAAGVAATGVLMLGSAVAAIKVGTSGIGAALKAAFAPPAGGSSGAVNTAQQIASAQLALRDTVQQTADANVLAARQVGDSQRTLADDVQAASAAQVQAARQVAMAERTLADAQKAAQQAQLDLNAARHQARMDLEDLSNQVADAALSQRGDVLAVQQAKLALDATLANPGANRAAREQAQLTYDQAVQRLQEQGLALDRLKAKQADASRAGVDGSALVVSAQAKVASAQRTVGDQTQALTDAQVQAQAQVAAALRKVGDQVRNVQDAQAAQARTAYQGAEQVTKAQQALQQAAKSAAGGGVDPLAAALAKLSPNARAFVEEIIRLKPALHDLKLDVQQRLFQGLSGEFRTAAETILPVLHASLDDTAVHLNTMAKGTIEAGTELGQSGVLGRALAFANKGLGNLAGLPGQVVTGLVKIGTAAGPAFERVTAGASGMATRVSDRIAAAFSSGGMQRGIDLAITLVGQLGTVLGNVGSIVGALFGAANASGGSFVQTLVVITGAMAAAFRSPEVQAGLTALYQTMGLLARTAGPLLGQALRALGPILVALAPGAQALIQALGPALSVVVRALGPVLTSLGRAVSAVAVAFAPVLTLIGTLVGALLPVLAPLLDGVAQIASQLAPLVAALAQAIGGALAPVFAQLPVIIRPLVTLLTALTGALLPVLTQLVVALSPSLGMIAQAFGQVMVALAPVLQQLAVLLGQQLQVLLPLLIPIIAAVGKFAAILAGNLAQALTGIVVPALRMFSQVLGGDFTGAAESAREVIRGIKDLIVREFVLMPAQIVGVFDDLAGELYKAGGRIIGALVDGIRSKAGSVTSTLGGVLKDARDLLPFSPARKGPFSGSGWSLHSGRAISTALAEGILSGQGRVQDATAQLMGTAHGPLGRQPAFAGSPFAMAGAGAGASGLHIEHYHESESGSARSTAEDLNWLYKGRG